jgi:hypothetical protein
MPISERLHKASLQKGVARPEGHLVKMFGVLGRRVGGLCYQER